jgi:hypothetical protein
MLATYVETNGLGQCGSGNSRSNHDRPNPQHFTFAPRMSGTDNEQLNYLGMP